MMLSVIENPLKDKQFIGKPVKDRHDAHFTGQCLQKLIIKYCLVVCSANSSDPTCPIYIPASQDQLESSTLPLYSEYVLFQESQVSIKYVLVVNKKP